jgi:hypothetical protein
MRIFPAAHARQQGAVPCWRRGTAFLTPVLISEGPEGSWPVQARWEGRCTARFYAEGEFPPGPRPSRRGGGGARLALLTRPRGQRGARAVPLGRSFTKTTKEEQWRGTRST